MLTILGLEMHYCPEGGWVVDASLLVPADPSDHHHPAVTDTVGCNRLRCIVCDEDVRQRPDLSFSCDEVPFEGAKALHAAEDWAAIPWVHEARGLRLYSCLCTVHVEIALMPTVDSDPDPVADIRLPWRCAGHPAATLPVDIDGLVVDSTTDLAAVVGRAFGALTPPGARVNAAGIPAAWLCRVYSRLEGLPQGDALARAVASGLSDDATIGPALWFFERFPRAEGFEAVLPLTEDRLTDSWPVKYFEEEPLQRTPLQVVLSRLDSVPEDDPDDLDRAAASVIREALLASHAAAEPRWFGALSQVGGGELAAAAPDLVRARGAHLGMMLDGLLEAGRPELVVVAGVALAEARVNRRGLTRWLDKPQNHRRPWTLVLLKKLAKKSKSRGRRPRRR